MPANVIMPALELAQETGKVLRWLKAPGDTVSKGEPIVEIETDKVTVEIEAPASGVLRDVSAREGDVIPVGQTIARIFAAGEVGAAEPEAPVMSVRHADAAAPEAVTARLTPASPKARRLAAERHLELTTLRGSGPGGAVLASDVPATAAPGVSTVWRIMAERMSQSWAAAPHFYLVREANVSRLVTWRERASRQTGARLTYTDLLVKLIAAAISQHPRVNVSWKDGAIVQHADINIGLAVALDDGLVVPVLHRADTLSLGEIVARREDVVGRAQAGKLRPADIQGGSFTISNLGMYGVDAFSAIVNPPQAAILAVGRIADRVVAVGGQAVVRPTVVLTLSCDHRAVDGARGAQFLGALTELVEEPLALLT